MIKTQIKKLILSSIFLDERRKNILLKFLLQSSPQNDLKLYDLLKLEKDSLKDILRTYLIKSGDTDGVLLNEKFNSMNKKMFTVLEKLCRSNEGDKLQDLLDELN